MSASSSTVGPDATEADQATAQLGTFLEDNQPLEGSSTVCFIDDELVYIGLNSGLRTIKAH